MKEWIQIKIHIYFSKNNQEVRNKIKQMSQIWKKITRKTIWGKTVELYL